MALVSFSNTVAHPRAMVVIGGDATPTIAAMLGPEGHIHVAAGTEAQLHVELASALGVLERGKILLRDLGILRLVSILGVEGGYGEWVLGLAVGRLLLLEVVVVREVLLVLVGEQTGYGLWREARGGLALGLFRGSGASEGQGAPVSFQVLNQLLEVLALLLLGRVLPVVLEGLDVVVDAVVASLLRDIGSGEGGLGGKGDFVAYEGGEGRLGEGGLLVDLVRELDALGGGLGQEGGLLLFLELELLGHSCEVGCFFWERARLLFLLEGRQLHPRIQRHPFCLHVRGPLVHVREALLRRLLHQVVRGLTHPPALLRLLLSARTCDRLVRAYLRRNFHLFACQTMPL